MLSPAHPSSGTARCQVGAPWAPQGGPHVVWIRMCGPVRTAMAPHAQDAKLRSCHCRGSPHLVDKADLQEETVSRAC